jgi:tRNA 2-thiocytidine biosynthesis protein TtcA
MAFPIIPCTLCGSQENLQRKQIGKMLKEWDKQPGRIESILRALTDVAPSHLLDRGLFDFAALKPAAPGPSAAVPIHVAHFAEL